MASRGIVTLAALAALGLLPSASALDSDGQTVATQPILTPLVSVVEHRSAVEVPDGPVAAVEAVIPRGPRVENDAHCLGVPRDLGKILQDCQDAPPSQHVYGPDGTEVASSRENPLPLASLPALRVHTFEAPVGVEGAAPAPSTSSGPTSPSAARTHEATEPAPRDRPAPRGPPARIQTESETSTFALVAALPASATLLALSLVLTLGVLVAAYTRMGRSNTLANATRERVFQHVIAAPGACANDVARATGIHLTTAQYHLRNLAQHDLVVPREVNGTVRFFAPGVPLSVYQARASPANETAIRILDTARVRPGASVSELARALGISSQLACYHVKRFVERGEMRVEPDGRSIRVFAAIVSDPSSA